MPPTARRALLVLLAPLLAALTGCAGTSPAPAPAPAPSSATAGSSAPGPAAQQVTLVLADGEVTGDTPLAPVAAGRPVRLSVSSDVADELHVHGVDETLPLTAGETGVLEFTPGAPGRFEVELHRARRVLTRLQVR